jgi:hypothetical protein
VEILEKFDQSALCHAEHKAMFNRYTFLSEISRELKGLLLQECCACVEQTARTSCLCFFDEVPDRRRRLQLGDGLIRRLGDQQQKSYAA